MVVREIRLVPGAEPPPLPGDKYLLRHEHTVVSLRQHPAMLLPSLSAALGALTAAVAVNGIAQVAKPVVIIVWILAIFLLARSGWAVVGWYRRFILVTNYRFILISRSFQSSIMAMPLNRLSEMSFHRSLAGNMLGYGTYTVDAEGKTFPVIDYVPFSEQLYGDVMNLAFSDIEDAKDEDA